MLGSLLSACVREDECAPDSFVHRTQEVFSCDCGAPDAIAECCIETAGRGGKDVTGADVPADVLSADAAICIAASQGMTPGLSTYFAVWEDAGSGVWSVEMIQEEECSNSGWTDGRADYWVVDGVTGEIKSRANEYYTAVVCAYG